MKRKHALKSILALAFAATMSLARAGAPAPAAAPAEPSGDGWWFRAAPYGWLTAVTGDVKVGPASAPVDISMSDTLDSLDMTFMGVFEAGYDRWSLAVDVVYGKLSQDIGAHGHLFDSFRFEQKQWFITPVLSYRLIDTDRFMLSAFAGARITVMDVELTGRLSRGGEVSHGTDNSWADPIIGIRGQAGLTDRLSFLYSGDIGGFGVSSDLIWNAFGGLGYDISDSVSLVAGYRALGLDYTKGVFTLDVISHGPVIGLEIRF